MTSVTSEAIRGHFKIVELNGLRGRLRLLSNKANLIDLQVLAFTYQKAGYDFFFFLVSIDLFEEITFPLSPRCTKGKWIICAQDWPSIIDANGKKKYCINFHVKDQNLEDLQTSILSPESQTFESFVNLEMVAPPTFRTGVPYSGKVGILASFQGYPISPPSQNVLLYKT